MASKTKPARIAKPTKQSPSNREILDAARAQRRTVSGVLASLMHHLPKLNTLHRLVIERPRDGTTVETAKDVHWSYIDEIAGKPISAGVKSAAMEFDHSTARINGVTYSAGSAYKDETGNWEFSDAEKVSLVILKNAADALDEIIIGRGTQSHALPIRALVELLGRKPEDELHPTAKAIAEFITSNPGSSGKEIAKGVSTGQENVRRHLQKKNPLYAMGFRNRRGEGYFPPT